MFLIAAKELFGDAVRDKKEKNFKNSIIEYCVTLTVIALQLL
jgi:hypothetical protein